jgi:hypothetical protein
VTPRSARHSRQAGLVRTCCLGFILLLALIGAAAYFGDRALAAPDLGAAPAGADDGEDQRQIALTLGMHLAQQLVAGPHGVVLLSEHDITVLIRAHNPHPEQYSNLAARVRERQLVVSADDHFGPVNLTPVLHLALALQGTSVSAIALHVLRVDVGQLPLPGFIADRVEGSVPESISIPSLFGAAPVLSALSDDIECVAVAANGVLIGVHRPGVGPEPATCDAAAR